MLIFSILIMSSVAVADDSKPLALPDTSKMNVPADRSGGMQVEMSCNTAEGRKLKAGEAGYETCLATSTSNAQNRGNSNPSGKPATSVDFKFGK